MKKILRFLFNPRLLLCLGIGWMITNGWSYVAFAMGTIYKIDWLIAISSAYLTFLWFPFTPEKIITVAIAIWLLRKLFPRDQQTLAVLRDIYHNVKEKYQNRKKDRKK